MSGWSVLESVFEVAGLRQISQDVVATDRLAELRKPSTRIEIGAIVGGFRAMTAQGVMKGLDKQGIDELENVMLNEMDSGCYIARDIHVFIGLRLISFTWVI